MRISSLSDLERGLAHSVNIDGDASGEIMRSIRDFDVIPAALAHEMGVTFAATTHTYELALAWVPHDLPIVAHFFVNKKPFPGSGGTFTGGRQFFPIPSDLVKAGDNEVAYTIRFLGSGWKFQLWGSVDDAHKKIDSGEDPDPSSNSDDRVIRKVNFVVGGG